MSINFTKTVGAEVVEFPAENAWVARDQQRNLGETLPPLILHILDYISNPGQLTYTLKPCTTSCPMEELPFQRESPPGEILTLAL